MGEEYIVKTEVLNRLTQEFKPLRTNIFRNYKIAEDYYLKKCRECTENGMKLIYQNHEDDELKERHYSDKQFTFMIGLYKED
jgi:hypothetical protein